MKFSTKTQNERKSRTALEARTMKNGVEVTNKTTERMKTETVETAK
jgi:hypothetical protein